MDIPFAVQAFYLCHLPIFSRFLSPLDWAPCDSIAQLSVPVNGIRRSYEIFVDTRLSDSYSSIGVVYLNCMNASEDKYVCTLQSQLGRNTINLRRLKNLKDLALGNHAN